MRQKSLILMAACSSLLLAQEIRMPASFDKLAAKADETVDVSLSGPMLKLAGSFLNEKDKDQAQAKSVIAGIESISVRSFKFKTDGQYDESDLNAVRSQVQSAPWGRIVGVRSKADGENVDVFFKDGGNGKLGGIVVIAAEPKELTVVSLVGTLDPSRLAEIGGQFGIPKLDVEIQGKKKAGK